VSIPFSYTKRLSQEDVDTIDRALKNHGLEIDDAHFDLLCYQVELFLEQYLSDRDCKMPSKADALSAIRKLHDVLIQTEQTGAGILPETMMHTRAQKWVHASGAQEALLDAVGEGLADAGEAPSGSLYSLCMSALIEACELALSENPPPAVWTCEGETDVVSAHTAKGGRPTNDAIRALTLRLAQTFQSLTKQRATDTEYGAFDDFLSACLTIVDPTRERGTNRKLIRAALYDVPWRVPKPRRKK